MIWVQYLCGRGQRWFVSLEGRLVIDQLVDVLKDHVLRTVRAMAVCMQCCYGIGIHDTPSTAHHRNWQLPRGSALPHVQRLRYILLLPAGVLRGTYVSHMMSHS